MGRFAKQRPTKSVNLFYAPYYVNVYIINKYCLNLIVEISESHYNAHILGHTVRSNKVTICKVKKGDTDSFL
jgi:hypothetical protein